MVKPYHVYLINGVASFTESWAECEAAIAGKHHKNFGYKSREEAMTKVAEWIKYKQATSEDGSMTSEFRAMQATARTAAEAKALAQSKRSPIRTAVHRTGKAIKDLFSPRKTRAGTELLRMSPETKERNGEQTSQRPHSPRSQPTQIVDTKSPDRTMTTSFLCFIFSHAPQFSSRVVVLLGIHAVSAF